jgi:UDP-2,3-diacylglucosamine pyrophosphatase LpxH
MKKYLFIPFVSLLICGVAIAGNGNKTSCSWANKVIARFGVITDIHHTNKADSTSRKYSVSLEKTQHFVRVMNHRRADFIIELGDFVDTLAGDRDPVENLTEIERVFTNFRGPQYHVLGNHEFDNVYRSDLLPMLNNTGIPKGQTYYSFDANGIHCVVLDADYTVAEPHLAFDMQDPANPFWNWTDAWIPETQLNWLIDDLAAADKPTVVFTHQVMHREITEDHTIKNADVVRGILENDGQVMAVFSGHDHRGEIAFRNGIHYMVLEGNVGMSLDWFDVSATDGMHPKKDSPFSWIEIRALQELDFEDIRNYEIRVVGNAQQYSFTDQVQILSE